MDLGAYCQIGLDFLPYRMTSGMLANPEIVDGDFLTETSQATNMV